MIQLPIPFHQQDTPNFCGPATAQMIVKPIINALLDQGDIEATMGAAPAAGESCKLGLTSPKQLELGLNATQQAHGGLKHQFKAYYFASQVNGTAATAAIVRTLRLGTGAAALIKGGGHWIAVTGASMPAGDPLGVHPEALFVNNPWPPAPGSLAHHAPTDGCGSGGIRGQAEHVTVPAGWYAPPYFTPVTMCRRTTQSPLLPDVYIIVGAAGLPMAAQAPAPNGGGTGESGPARDARPKEIPMCDDHGHDEDRGHVRDPVEVVRGAIDRYGLAADVDAAHSDRPRVVQYLEDDADWYYLVPLRWPDGSVLVGRVSVQHLTYLGAQLRPPKEIRTDAHYHLAEPSDVEGWIRRGRITFGGHGDGDYRVREELGWRPCVESRSPYHPFYQVTLKGETVGFMDLNGTPYTKLNDLPGG